MNRSAVQSTCPSWCTCTHPADRDLPGVPLEVHHSQPSGDAIRVHLERHDEAGEVGEAFVFVVSADVVDGVEVLDGLHPDHPLTIDQAEALAGRLLAAVAAARGDSA